jgi:beta-galactosidase
MRSRPTARPRAHKPPAAARAFLPAPQGYVPRQDHDEVKQDLAANGGCNRKKNQMKKHCSVLLSLCAAVALAQEARLGDELLQNGNFESPQGWQFNRGARRVSEAGNHWLLLDAGDKPASLSANQRVPMGPRYWKLRLGCRVRATNVGRGVEGWNDARIAMSFHGRDGKMVGGWPNVLHFTGSTDGWERHERDFIVPQGAAYLELSCSLLAATGKVEWGDLSLKLLKFTPQVEDATLPAGVEARWDLAGAFREETPTRGRVCINGLWRFHPADLKSRDLPAAGSGWGYFKVPGSWHPPTARMRPIGPDIWETTALDLARTDAAWYQRVIAIPGEWAGRRMFVELDNPKQAARVLVDGREAGTVAWPGGRVEITSFVKPGATHALSVFVNALGGDQEKLVVMGPTQMEKAREEIRHKGLAGDCFLVSEPVGARITDVFVKPSVRRKELGVQCELTSAPENFKLETVVLDGGRVVKRFTGSTPALAGRWGDPKLWDLDQPNLYQLSVRLLDAHGNVLDETTPITFGFREFWIEGRDFMLNGKRFHLRCLDCSNAGDFATATLTACQATFARARALGFNYVIHSHYDYEPQSFAYIEDLLRAGDETGFPMSYTIRHVKQIYRDMDDPAKRAGWETVVDYEMRRVRNHPCVFMWAMNHNFTGWADDQNPSQLDGLYEPKPSDDERLAARRHAARTGESLVMARDGTRPAYNHESGNLGQMITLNNYLNWTPLQERIEWPSHWAGAGVKPLFLVEFGLPHQASWGGHRTGPFIWRNKVNSEPLAAEFAAITTGDHAYDLTGDEDAHARVIERIYARHEPFHITEVLGAYWQRRWEHNFLEIKSLFTAQTWPAFRTWNLSGILPWDQEDFFKPRAGGNREPVELTTEWARLQRPGIAPDFQPASDDWLRAPKFEGCFDETSLSRMFRRVNRDTLAWIAGPPSRFTAKDHIFAAGEKVTKQAAVLNDLREPATATWEWTATLAGKIIARGSGSAKIPAGDHRQAPFRFDVPDISVDARGVIELRATLNGRHDETLEDRFEFDALVPARVAPVAGVACYDPKGATLALLRAHGLAARAVERPVCPADCKLFIVGREAITTDGPALDVTAAMRAGATVLVFEQSEEVLQKRWGFRTASPGTRRVFVRQPAHPACRGLSDELLRDWRGNATLVEAYPAQGGFHKRYPTTDWCGFTNTRTWQWGNYGCVASVVIEKPQRGNWSFPLDCEFDLQYAPLLEWLAPGGGRVIFSQLDLTGRDASDPAAERLLANLLAYAQSAPAVKWVNANVVGAKEGWLATTGRDAATAQETLHTEDASRPLVVMSGADPDTTKAAAAKARTIICVGLEGDALSRILPFPVKTEPRAVTHTLIGRPTGGALAGLGDGEFHWRGWMTVPAIVSAPPELKVAGTGIFAEGSVGGQQVVLVQFTPEQFDWKEKPCLKLSKRRAIISLARILTNCGVCLSAPVTERLAAPPAQAGERRWLDSFYLDEPATLDDPYRYERW